MGTGSTIAGSNSERRGLSYWMERTLKELEKVRTSPEPDAVHDLRVALRRCRSVAAVMEEVDPDRSWREMRKLGRKLFSQLGELRDVQVLEDWAKKLGAESDPVRLQLLAIFEKQEAELRESAMWVAGKFDQKAWKRLESGLQRRARVVPPDGLAAQCLALERLEAAKELHTRALRAERPRPWHELRIGVKRFRYTVESLLPEKYELWGDQLKRVQDLLGEVHDLDVLADTIVHSAAEESEETRTRWAERIASERHERIETYRQLSLGKTSLWQEWRLGLPHGETLEAAALAQLGATARALDPNLRRTGQVSRLAMRLYDGLKRAEAAPVFAESSLRKVMRAAARLHGIGTGLDPDAPQKAARDFLRDLPAPAGWSQEEWGLLINVVRYHRGEQPDAQHKAFARLTEEEQQAISAMAGVLRLARALRKCGCQTPVGLRVEKSVDALIVRAPGLQESEEAAARLAAGKYLLERVLRRPLIVQSATVTSRVVEIPRSEEPPASAAAASD
ncbi:MAG TPA: CHAD domain-containing protein [Candidatus Dormibacteraeota bacterium]|nr:CHAD domain-containing protein [Candidatus Dormibacteraeota bacterium]